MHAVFEEMHRIFSDLKCFFLVFFDALSPFLFQTHAPYFSLLSQIAPSQVLVGLWSSALPSLILSQQKKHSITHCPLEKGELI